MLAVSLFFAGCDPVGSSPEPGLLRVTLRADPLDSIITIADQTYNLNALKGVPARMFITISGGRAYRDTSYANLFTDSQDLSPEAGDTDFNILARTQDRSLPLHLVYETLLPPATYDSLRIVVNADEFEVGDFNNDVNLPPGGSSLVTFRRKFQVESEEATVVNLQMRPLESLTRFKDVFYFNPQLEVENIEKAASAQ